MSRRHIFSDLDRAHGWPTELFLEYALRKLSWLCTEADDNDSLTASTAGRAFDDAGLQDSHVWLLQQLGRAHESDRVSSESNRRTEHFGIQAEVRGPREASVVPYGRCEWIRSRGSCPRSRRAPTPEERNESEGPCFHGMPVGSPGWSKAQDVKAQDVRRTPSFCSVPRAVFRSSRSTPLNSATSRARS